MISPTDYPAQTMAESTLGYLPQLVTDEAFAGLCEAYFRTGNKLLYALADTLIHAEANYALRMRQENNVLSADHEAGSASRETRNQER